MSLSPFSELNDHGELIDEEVICRVNDDGDVVEVTLVGEILVVILPLVLTERTREGRAGCLRRKREASERKRISLGFFGS